MLLEIAQALRLVQISGFIFHVFRVDKEHLAGGFWRHENGRILLLLLHELFPEAILVIVVQNSRQCINEMLR